MDKVVMWGKVDGNTAIRALLDIVHETFRLAARSPGT